MCEMSAGVWDEMFVCREEGPGVGRRGLKMFVCREEGPQTR